MAKAPSISAIVNTTMNYYRVRYLTEVDNGTPPVAWEVKDFADGWILCLNHADAVREAEDTGATIRNLYRKTP